jgi:hypothetical protein
MTPLIVSSSKTEFLVEGCKNLFKKYTPFDKIPFPLVCVTNREDWAGSLKSFISNNITDDKILLLIDDYYFFKPLEFNRFQELLGYNADKWDLQGQVAYWKNKKEGDIFVASPDAQYRRSTQAAVWKKDYLLQTLSFSYPINPWQYELANILDCDRRIIGTDRNIAHYANIFYKGKLQNYEADKLSLSDRLLSGIDKIQKQYLYEG